ncbi:hypothetical protein LCGC14_2691390 [marine sediment metagenome]|uniref:Uncharacterized protein n=1 Tax=marine sediment metagenome TaxID=412755 RepID=A0A0F9CA73_9ZZZZ
MAIFKFGDVEVDMDYDEVVDYLMSQGKSESAAIDLMSHSSENEWQKAKFDFVLESIMGDLPYLYSQIKDVVIREGEVEEQRVTVHP